MKSASGVRGARRVSGAPSNRAGAAAPRPPCSAARTRRQTRGERQLSPEEVTVAEHRDRLPPQPEVGSDLRRRSRARSCSAPARSRRPAPTSRSACPPRRARRRRASRRRRSARRAFGRAGEHPARHQRQRERDQPRDHQQRVGRGVHPDHDAHDEPQRDEHERAQRGGARSSSTRNAASSPRQNQSGACWVIENSTCSVGGAAHTSSTAVRLAANRPATCHTDHAVSPRRPAPSGTARPPRRGDGPAATSSPARTAASRTTANSPSTTCALGGAMPNSSPITGADTASASRLVLVTIPRNRSASKIR